jgi:hypothetical protein
MESNSSKTDHEVSEETGLVRRNRLIAVSFFWIAFGFIGTFVYASFVHDVGATFFALWTLVLPMVLPLVWLFDDLVSTLFVKGEFQGTILALDAGFALVFWIPPLLH